MLASQLPRTMELASATSRRAAAGTGGCIMIPCPTLRIRPFTSQKAGIRSRNKQVTIKRQAQGKLQALPDSVFSPCPRRVGAANRSVVAAAAAGPPAPTATGGKGAEEVQVVQSSLPGCAVKLTVTVPPTYSRKCYKRTLDRLRKIVGPVRGFPQNKPLPDGIVASAVGGEKKFKLAIIEDILFSSFETVMPRYNAVLVPNSDQILTKAEDLAANLSLDQPLTYEIQFEVMPTVKWKKAYTDIELSIQDTGSDATDQQAADDLIKQYLKNKAYQQVVQGRGLARGDIAVIDMDIRSVGSPVALPGMKKEMFLFDTDVDPLGLTSHVEGMELGAKREFTFNFPEDWYAEMLRGSKAEGKIKLHELFSWVLPEFNDEFVTKYYPAYTSAEAMKTALVQGTALERFKLRDQQIQEAFYEELLARVDVQVPERLVVEMGYNEYQTNLMQMVSKGETRIDDLKSMATEEMADEYVKASHDKLVDLVKIVLASEEIARAESIQVSPEEINAEFDVACKEFESQKLEYDPEKLKEQVEEQLKGIKVLDWVKENCKINIIPLKAAGDPQTAAA